MKMIVTIWVILLGTLLSSMAQDLESIQRDLDGSISRLTKQRELIAAEKPALGQAFQTTRSDLVEKRRKVRIARMAKSDRDELLKGLEKKQYLYQQDHEYITGQIRDYGLKLEIFLLPSERVLHGAALEALREQGSLPAETLQSRLAVIETGIDRLEQLMGGYVVKGEAVAPDGELKQGSFALAGPLAWFIADDDTLAGAVVRERGLRSPRVLPGSR